MLTPIKFREYGETHPEVDLNLEVRYIDGCLRECGITATTEIFSLVLTPESERLYRAAIEEATKGH
jgi:hypothetical protein